MKEDTLSDTAGIADSCLFLAGYLLPKSNLNCLCLLPITDLILFSYFVIASWIFFIPIFLTWIWQVNCVLNFLSVCFWNDLDWFLWSWRMGNTNRVARQAVSAVFPGILTTPPPALWLEDGPVICGREFPSQLVWCQVVQEWVPVCFQSCSRVSFHLFY